MLTSEDIAKLSSLAIGESCILSSGEKVVCFADKTGEYPCHNCFNHGKNCGLIKCYGKHYKITI